MNQNQKQELCEILGIETLEERKMDSLDFHELGVWNIEKALELAYTMGQMKGRIEARR
jgi:hypothetical protein